MLRRNLFRTSRTQPPRLLLAGTLILAVSLWVAWGRRPVILSVPVTPAGGDLTLLGSSFGERQGNSTVAVTTDAGATTEAKILSRSDSRIVAALPSLTGKGAAQVIRRGVLGERATKAMPFVVQAPDLPSRPFGYAVPVQPESPWPTFRCDQRNSGRSPLPAIYTGDAAWSFATGKGIFSTPIIDGDGVVYVGSANHNFYAILPDGREKWRFPTGEIIDSATALPRVGLNRPGILLLDDDAMQAVTLDYHANLSATADAAGNLASVTLRIPAGTALPATVQAVVMADVFPLYRETLRQQ